MTRLPLCRFLLAAALVLPGCSDRAATGPITLSVIGTRATLADPARGTLTTANAVLVGATGQGLVAFDAAGQIEPALAERWTVTSDGLSYIFRIRRAHWISGEAVGSRDVAQALQRQIAPASRNALRPMFANVAAILPMTAQVIEIRLKAPQPNLLQLLAQPEMAVVRGDRSGTGPYRIHSLRNGVTRLRPLSDPPSEGPEVDTWDMRLRGEAAAPAIARFSLRSAALVTGGSFADLAYASAARPPSAQFHVDPAYGMFGLQFVRRVSWLDTPERRQALAIAIDREAIVKRFGVAKWRASPALLPAQLDSDAPPAVLDISQLDIGERRARARAIMRGDATDTDRVLRIALPEGPGSRLLFAALAADWRRIGIRAERAAPGSPADLRLIDQVAPISSALWYLDQLSCRAPRPCSAEADALYTAARASGDLDQRARLIAQADALQTAAQYYIPLALPLRWSLVSPELTGWRESAFAVHPLAELRAERR